jgi:FkbM family methyltransferase
MARVVGPRLSRALRGYYFGPDHPMKLRFWSWLRRSTRYPLLTTPYCERAWLALDERDYVQRRVITEGFYEPEVWDALFSFASASEVLWDIGAHVGTFTVRSMLDPRVAMVRAFEPDPVTRTALQVNVALNRSIGAPCSIHSEALGANIGDSVLHRGPVHNLGMSSIVSRPSQRGFSVRRTSVDELVFAEGIAQPTLLKIDVEGSERNLLVGAERLLRTQPPKAVVIEAEANPDGSLRDEVIGAQLRRAGYTISWIRRPDGEMWPRENYLAAAPA